MPEETETTEQPPADAEETVEETATEAAESAEAADDAQEAEPKPEDKPFDRKQAEAKIRKANSEAANLRKRLKELEPLAKKAKEFEDAQKTETQRLTEELEAANARVAAVRLSAARSKVEALAATATEDRAAFADPEDAASALDLASYIDDEGRIDADAIKADLAALLERKPHWAKPQEGIPRRPAPDRTQASGANQPRSQKPEDMFAGFLKSQLK